MSGEHQRPGPAGPRGPAGPGPRPEPAGVDVTEQVQWIKGCTGLAQLGTDALVEQADRLGAKLAPTLNTTQIRKILARVNALNVRFHQGFDREEVPLLKVRLVYAAAREKRAVGPLADVLLPAVDRIHCADDYRWFARFVEAVVAYHRYRGGKD